MLAYPQHPTLNTHSRSLLLFQQLEEFVYTYPKILRQPQGEDGGWDVTVLFDGIDGLTRNANQLSQPSLGNVFSRPFYLKGVPDHNAWIYV